MIFRRTVVGVLVLVVGVPAVALAAGPAAGPLQGLQQQIDRLGRRYEALADRMTPPALSHTLTCVSPLLATIGLEASGRQEIAYYAVQEQGGSPPANFVTFVEPGRTAVTHAFDVEVGPAPRTFLLVAADVAGNVARVLVDLAPTACAAPCPPDTLCP